MVVGQPTGRRRGKPRAPNRHRRRRRAALRRRPRRAAVRSAAGRATAPARDRASRPGRACRCRRTTPLRPTPDAAVPALPNPSRSPAVSTGGRSATGPRRDATRRGGRPDTSPSIAAPRGRTASVPVGPWLARSRRRSLRTPRSNPTRPAPASSGARTGSAPARPGSRRRPRRRRGRATAASVARHGRCPTRTACDRAAGTSRRGRSPTRRRRRGDPRPLVAARCRRRSRRRDHGGPGTSRHCRRRPGLAATRRPFGYSVRKARRAGARTRVSARTGDRRVRPPVHRRGGVVDVADAGVAKQHRSSTPAATGRPGTRRRGSAPTPTIAASARHPVPRRQRRGACPSSSASGRVCRCSTRPRRRTRRCAGRGWPAARPG